MADKSVEHPKDEKASEAAAIIGKKGGSAKTPDKIKAAQENGMKGGSEPQCLCGKCRNCKQRENRRLYMKARRDRERKTPES